MARSFRLASLARTAAAVAVTARLDGGTLRLYAGPQPADPDAAPGAAAALLAECRFADPAFAPGRGGAMVAQPLGAARVTATGAPTWFRARSRAGVSVFDGSVGPDGSGADLELSVSALQAGAELVITSLTYAQPSGADKEPRA